MTQQELNGLFEAISKGFSGSEVLEQEVPSIDLYMDQITTILDEGLFGDRRVNDSKPITKTMINNYSKDGLLQRIKGKKYSKQHILMILLIYNLKQSLSISDISKLLEGLKEHLTVDKEGYNPQAVSQLYGSCVESKRLQREMLPDIIKQMLPDIDEKDERQAAAQAVIALSALSSLCRRGAEELIDSYF